jgi:hypothetical protein
MFGSIMLNMIIGNIKSWLVITMKLEGHFLITFSSDKRFLTHRISQTPSAMALYLVSVVDRDTTNCFLLRHDTKFPPTNTQYPEHNLPSQHHNILQHLDDHGSWT